jgi:hypothetical protein
MDAGTEASVLGALSRPVAFVVLILAFLAGAWVGRGSVLLETRARRRHLDEAVGKIVAGVVEGLKGTSGVSTPAPTNAAADAVTPIVRGVLAGLATPRRHADADSGADAARDGGSASRERREGSGMASPPSRRLSARARARAEAAAAEQTLARAEAVASAAAAASAAGRADMSTSSAPLRCSDSDSDDAAEREVTSRSVPVEETVIATVIDGIDETRNADDAEDRVSETNDLPVEMDVDASMEDAFPPEEGDGGDVPADVPADVSSAEFFARTETQADAPADVSSAEFFARTETQADAPEHRRDGEQKQNERNDDVGLDARGARGPDQDDEKNASLADSCEPHATPASEGLAPSSSDTALHPLREPESPTRLAAAAAHEAQRAAEIERQRGAAKAAKKAARSERVLAERMLSHRKGIEEAEARASEMDDARADAQRFLERSGAHALAAAGCMGATLLRLELIDAQGAADLRSMPENKLEGAYKRALAKNHPDRSAARGDDVAAAARCEETFKLLQAAHLRWTEMGKPIGDAADARARAAYPFGAHTSSAATSSPRTNPGSPGFYASRRTQAAAAAAAAASAAAAAANGGGRSWRPGESVNAGAPPSGAAGTDYRDAFRERARRSAAAAADALRREEERVAAELAAERAREASRARAEEARRAAEAERARRESAAHRAKAAEEAAERAAAFASEARRRARDENLEAAAAADAAFAAATTPPPRDDEVSPRDGDENETEFLARERSPARFKARRPPARDDPGKERIERNMDKL